MDGTLLTVCLLDITQSMSWNAFPLKLMVLGMIKRAFVGDVMQEIDKEVGSNNA